MTQKTMVHNLYVTYEENALAGIHYLRDSLDAKEAGVFFNEAKRRGSAEFEDRERHQYTLIYQNGAYVLVRR